MVTKARQRKKSAKTLQGDTPPALEKLQPQKLLSGVNHLQLPPAKIICPTCLGKHSDICYRCEGSGRIFNLVRFRAGYIGTAKLPMGVA